MKIISEYITSKLCVIRFKPFDIDVSKHFEFVKKKESKGWELEHVDIGNGLLVFLKMKEYGRSRSFGGIGKW